MPTRFYALLTLLALGGIFSVHGQSTQSVRSDTTITLSAPLELGLTFYVSVPPKHLPVADSVRRAVYKRLKVRSVTKLQLRDNGQTDSLEYVKVDRQGNQSVTYNTLSKHREERQFDSQGRTTQLLRFPTDGYPFWIREVFYPQLGNYEGFRRAAHQPEQLEMRSAHSTQADTVRQECWLLEPVMHRGSSLTRVVGKQYPTHADTVRLDIVGYDERGGVLATESHYFIKKLGRMVEQGTVSYVAALRQQLLTSAEARRWQSQGLSEAALIVRLQRQLRGHYQATTRLTYDAANHVTLILRSHPSSPSSHADTETASFTFTAVPESSTAYAYDKRGNLLREEWQMSPGKTGREITNVVTQWTYSAKGLKETEEARTGQYPPQRYVYRYTYY